MHKPLTARPDDSGAVQVLCRMHALLVPWANNADTQELLLVDWRATLERAARACGYIRERDQYARDPREQQEAEELIARAVHTSLDDGELRTSPSEALGYLRDAVKAGRKPERS
jgi:hypothetical protein